MPHDVRAQGNTVAADVEAIPAFPPFSAGPVAERIDDPALALALAHAARSVEHIADVSAGRYGVAATYGPGQRIVGIVFHCVAPSQAIDATPFIVEAHVVVAAAAMVEMTRQDTQQGSTPHPQDRTQSAVGAPGHPILLHIADDVRRALIQKLRELRPDEMWAIDVTIDDLCEEGAPVR